MVEKIDLGFRCTICNSIYQTSDKAEKCEQEHDKIYVPFKREDLFKLLQFIMTKDDSLLSKSLIDTLNKYKKGYYR
jgi:hypothetical protein